MTNSTTFLDSKNHYEILDGLRGVAALMVIIFHLLEIYSGGKHELQIINHGYLAVDFFYVLSGFVIGYAYDERWNSMSLVGFFKRRLIRLHPLIILGMIIGAIGFYFSASPTLFPTINQVPLSNLIVIMLIGFTLIPVPTSMDIRGWGEMHPLNGPGWSLFFEYIANILYAIILRKLSNQILTLLAASAAIALIHLAITHGDIIGGWSITKEQLHIGFVRLSYPFLAGLILSRIIKPYFIQNAFLWSSLLIISVLSVPRVGDGQHIWMNGLYDALSIIIIFPLIVFIGASGKINHPTTLKICNFLGDISYPIYITHFPFIYIYSSWVVDNNITFLEGLPMTIFVFFSTIIVAYLALKWYDIPIRKYLTRRFMK